MITAADTGAILPKKQAIHCLRKQHFMKLAVCQKLKVVHPFETYRKWTLSTVRCSYMCMHHDQAMFPTNKKVSNLGSLVSFIS